MSSIAKSLGQFVADVLSVVNAATYVPASVLVGGGVLSGLFATSDATNPITALADAPAPTFAELALFVFVVLLVAAVLEPLQFQIVRVFEGYSSLFSSRLKAKQDERSALSKRRNKLAADRSELRRELSNTDTPLSDEDRLQKQRELREKTSELRTVSAEFDAWPRQHRVLSTKLGNIIRGFEDRASEVLAASDLRDSIPGNGEIQDLLPWAYFAVPEETRKAHDRFRSQVQSMTTLIVIAPIVSVMVAVSMAGFSWAVAWAFVACGLGALISIASLFAARDAGSGYGVMLLAIAQQFAGDSFRVESRLKANAA